MAYIPLMAESHVVRILTMNLLGDVIAYCDLPPDWANTDLYHAVEGLRDAGISPRSSLVGLVGGQAASVMDAQKTFGQENSLEKGIDRTHASTALIGARIDQAQYVLGARSAPQHQMVPPIFTFQHLFFGADSDAANIACAALVERLRMRITDEDPDDDALDQIWEEEFGVVDDAHPEISNTEIRESIYQLALSR